MRASFTIVCLSLIGIAAPVSMAKADANEAARRRIVAPLIRKLTDCVARNAVNDPSVLNAYRYGGLDGALGPHLGDCRQEMATLLEAYEDSYGDGSAEQFIKGPYLADLPRAVLTRIKPQLEAKKVKAEGDEAQAEANRKAQLAEYQRQEEANRQAVVQAEADRKAAEDRAALEQRQRVEVAKGAMGVLRDKFYACVDKQLVSLIKSGESAEVLAGAATTICNEDLLHLQNSAVEESRLEKDMVPSPMVEAVLREKIKDLIKERVVADAVQAKAGVGSFAHMSDPSSPGSY